jgi:hypothetical protein
MEKALELGYGGLGRSGWIKMELSSGRMKPVFIDPAIIKDYFPDFQETVPYVPVPEHEHSEREPVFRGLRKLMDAFVGFFLPWERGLAMLSPVRLEVNA